MHLHKARVRRHDAYAETIRAAFGRGDGSLVNIIAVSISTAALIEDGRRRIADVTVIHFTVVRFDAHMLWIDRPEMDARRDLQRFTSTGSGVWRRRSRRGKNSRTISRPEYKVARYIPSPFAVC